MILTSLSIALLIVTILLALWVLWIRFRGNLGFWTRSLTRREFWSVGVEVAKTRTKDEELALLRDIAAFVRTLELESGRVVRQWDLRGDSQFVGLVFEKPLHGKVIEAPFQLRHFPGKSIIRVSGQANEDGVTAGRTALEFAEEAGVDIDSDRPIKLSGQSFSLFEWELTKPPETPFARESLSERVFQLKEVVLVPIFCTLFGLALVGTREPALMAVGIVLLILLSGAGKFIYLINREDEAQEGHLQNY